MRLRQVKPPAPEAFPDPVEEDGVTAHRSPGAVGAGGGLGETWSLISCFQQSAS